MENAVNKIKAGEKLTTKETEEVLDFMDETADQIQAAASDGKLNWQDLPKLLKVVKKINPALKNIKQVWPEMKDLDDAEISIMMARLTTTVTKWATAIATLAELQD